MSDEEDKIAELTKDNERLRRRVKLLERKLKRTHTEVQTLTEELDLADVKSAASVQIMDDSTCPKCGYAWDSIDLPIHKSLYICRCGHRETK